MTAKEACRKVLLIRNPEDKEFTEIMLKIESAVEKGLTSLGEEGNELEFSEETKIRLVRMGYYVRGYLEGYIITW